jgi:hypothetical protein
MAWSALASHFSGMDWTLTATKYSKPRAAANPGRIDDCWIEDESVDAETLSHLNPKVDYHAEAHAANCKSPAFVIPE